MSAWMDSRTWRVSGSWKSASGAQEIEPRAARVVLGHRGGRVRNARAAARVDDLEVRARTLSISEVRELERLFRESGGRARSFEGVVGAAHGLEGGAHVGSSLA